MKLPWWLETFMFMFINRAYLGPHLQAIDVVVELRNLLRPGVGQSIDRVVLGKNAEMKVNIYMIFLHI